MHDVFVFHAAATWALVGLIWVVQLVVYPQFLNVREDDFAAYHASHMTRISLVVIPLVLAEIGTAAWLVWGGNRNPWLLASLVFVGVNAASTALIQAPLHGQLSVEYSEKVIRRLLLTNWLRTVAWSVRGVCLLVALTTA